MTEIQIPLITGNFNTIFYNLPSYTKIDDVLKILNLDENNYKLFCNEHKEYHTINSYNNIFIKQSTTISGNFIYKNYSYPFTVQTFANKKNTLKYIVQHLLTNDDIIIELKLILNSHNEYNQTIKFVNDDSFDVEIIENNYLFVKFKNENYELCNCYLNIINYIHRKSEHLIDVYYSKYKCIFNGEIFIENTITKCNKSFNYLIIEEKNEYEYNTIIDIYDIKLYGFKNEPIKNNSKLQSMIKIKIKDNILFENINTNILYGNVHIFVKTLTGKTITLDDVNLLLDTVNDVKIKIRETQGVPLDQQLLIHAGCTLENNKKLSCYSIYNESTLHMALNLRGGGGDTFVDVNQNLQQSNWSHGAPLWRVCNEGLCLEGKCMNINCCAFNKNVIMNKKFTQFDLLKDKFDKCPMCKEIVEAKTFIVNNCLLKIIFKKENKQEQSIVQTIGNNPTRPFDADKQSTYEYLTISAQHIISNKLQYCKDDLCCICLDELEQHRVIKTKCNHYYHNICLIRWMLKCNKCPLCGTKCILQF